MVWGRPSAGVVRRLLAALSSEWRPTGRMHYGSRSCLKAELPICWRRRRCESRLRARRACKLERDADDLALQHPGSVGRDDVAMPALVPDDDDVATVDPTLRIGRFP